jgi:hypothetical protein
MISHISHVFDDLAALDITLRVGPVAEAAKAARSILVQVYCANSEPTHIHAVTASRRFTELAVFDAQLYIQVRRLDEFAEGCAVCEWSRSQLHMTHELASALQQVGRIGQRRALKEPHIDVRSEYIDVAEGRISQTCDRTAVMQELSNFVSALSHHLKPLLRDASQLTVMLFHPRVDGVTPFHSAIQSEQLRSHHRSTLSA